ncbi:MAG: hypothetical protein U1B78_06410 [Dehalococcoidia bacterium]|nr:hypothetical protein [Dehalococcoidia bacterium]
MRALGGSGVPPAGRRRVRGSRLLRVPQVAGVLALVMLVSFAALQRGPAAHASDPVAVARAYLQQRLAAQGATAQATDFAVIEYRESRAARHVHFQQTLNGLPLYGAYLSVNLEKDADRVSLVTGRDLPDVGVTSDRSSVTAERATLIARRTVGARGDVWGNVTVDPVYFAIDNTRAVRAWQVVVPAIDPLGEWLVMVSAVDGSVLHTDNRIAFDHPANGQVFDPNPVVSSGGAIPPPPDCDDNRRTRT